MLFQNYLCSKPAKMEIKKKAIVLLSIIIY